MIESSKSLSYIKNYCSVLEKIARLHDIKQNEKHPLIFNSQIWKEKCWDLSEMGEI